MMLGSNAEFCLLAANRVGFDSTNLAAEQSDRIEDIPTDRHVRADNVPDLAGRGSQPAIRATDDPKEFVRKPTGLASDPIWFDRTTDGNHLIIRKRGDKTLDPCCVGDRVVIKERNEVCLGGTNSGIACAGKAPRTVVGDRCDALQLVPDAQEERRVVVDDDDYLDGSE